MSINNDLYNDLVFLDYPLGKPDPKLPYSFDEKDKRTRVAQKGQKELSCWYYGIRRICQHIGKNPPEELKEARRVEVIFSSARKLLSLNDNTKEITDHHIHALKEMRFYKKEVGLKRDVIAANLGRVKQLSNQIKERHQNLCDPKCFDAQIPLLEEFCAQSRFDDFEPFAEDTNVLRIKKIIKITCQILGDDVEMSSKALFEKEWTKKKWSDLDNIEKSKFYYSTLLLLFVRKHNLKESEWHPSQSIDKLGEVLKKHGRLAIRGFFGQSYYVDAPFQAETIQGKAIWGWRSNAERKSIVDGHIVIIVGVNLQSGRIYFVDPIDESDPNLPESQKVYTMSYRRLCESISNLEGTFWLDENKKPAHLPGDHFAWHA